MPSLLPRTPDGAPYENWAVEHEVSPQPRIVLKFDVMVWNSIGSAWHRWDPHLHAPGTALADQFGGDWEAYLTKIEISSPQVRALGVTDYFSIRTYKAAKAHKAAGRMPDVKLIFPNVEIRPDIKTEKVRPINMHLLFSPEDPDHEQEIERILNGKGLQKR